MGKDVSLEAYPSNYVVVDIETTGLSPANSEIIEISAIKVRDGKNIAEFSKLIKPKGYVSSFITSLTGITREMLVDACDLGETLAEFDAFCGNDVILGHNVKFDIRFLDANMRRLFDKPFENDYIDTLRIARKSLPELKSHKLGVLAEYYGCKTKGMHRALKDCQVTDICYKNMVNTLLTSV